MGIKKAKAKVVMSAYNKVNNIYCGSHDELINKVLKKEWKFDDVVSDWGAALETVENANGGRFRDARSCKNLGEKTF